MPILSEAKNLVWCRLRDPPGGTRSEKQSLRFDQNDNVEVAVWR